MAKKLKRTTHLDLRKMEKRMKRTPKDALTELLLEFIEAAVHEFL